MIWFYFAPLPSKKFDWAFFLGKNRFAETFMSDSSEKVKVPLNFSAILCTWSLSSNLSRINQSICKFILYGEHVELLFQGFVTSAHFYEIQSRSAAWTKYQVYAWWVSFPVNNTGWVFLEKFKFPKTQPAVLYFALNMCKEFDLT